VAYPTQGVALNEKIEGNGCRAAYDFMASPFKKLISSFQIPYTK
jgi:hypothetical protein